MGYKSERWEELLRAVVDVMEVERDMVLCRVQGGHSEAATDARWVLVRLACEELTDVEIAKLSGLSRQTVNEIRNHGDERLKRWGVKMGMRKVRERVVKSEDPFPADSVAQGTVLPSLRHELISNQFSGGLATPLYGKE